MDERRSSQPPLAERGASFIAEALDAREQVLDSGAG